MRGRIDEQQVLFHVFNIEERIRADHPLREVKRRVVRFCRRCRRFLPGLTAVQVAPACHRNDC